MIVYRFAQWYPDLITHVFSVCTPFMPPSDQFISTSELVKGPIPQFGYQLQLAGPEVEANIKSSERIAQFLKGMYGGKSDDGKVIFSPQTGVDFDVIDNIGAPPLMNQEVSTFYQVHDRLCLYEMKKGTWLLHYRICAQWHAWSL